MYARSRAGRGTRKAPSAPARDWHRLATDLRPEHIDDFRHTISLNELPQALEEIVTTGFVGRVVVEITDPAGVD